MTVADRPTQTATSIRGFIATRGGETHLLGVRDDEETSVAEAGESGGTIYTDVDMPSLEELLRAHEVVYAVLELPAPDLGFLDESAGSSRTPPATAPASSGRLITIVLTLGTAAVFVGSGIVLTSLALLGRPVGVNPYFALTILLAGAALLTSTTVAIRDCGWIE